MRKGMGESEMKPWSSLNFPLFLRFPPLTRRKNGLDDSFVDKFVKRESQMSPRKGREREREKEKERTMK